VCVPVNVHLSARKTVHQLNARGLPPNLKSISVLDFGPNRYKLTDRQIDRQTDGRTDNSTHKTAVIVACGSELIYSWSDGSGLCTFSRLFVRRSPASGPRRTDMLRFGRQPFYIGARRLDEALIFIVIRWC